MKYKKRSRVNNITLVIATFCFITILIFAHLKNSLRLENSIQIDKESNFYLETESENFIRQDDYTFFTESEGMLC